MNTFLLLHSFGENWHFVKKILLSAMFYTIIEDLTVDLEHPYNFIRKIIGIKIKDRVRNISKKRRS